MDRSIATATATTTVVDRSAATAGAVDRSAATAEAAANKQQRRGSDCIVRSYRSIVLIDLSTDQSDDYSSSSERTAAKASIRIEDDDFS